MNITVCTDNCDAAHRYLVEESATSRVELKLEFERIVSVQSKNKVKLELCGAIQAELSKFQWIIAGSVNVEFLWYLHETERQETDKVGDIDNITKPILDALTGPRGILIDDCQIGSLHTFWQSRNHMTTSDALYIRVDFNNDYSLLKDNLFFLQYSGAVCAPINIDIKDHKELLSALFLVKQRRMQRALASKIKEMGGDVDRMFVASNWEIHRTRLGPFDRSTILSVAELKSKCMEHGLTWGVLRQIWRRGGEGR